MIWLIHRFVEAFTRPALMRSFVDDFYIILGGLLILAFVLGTLFLIFCWWVGHTHTKRKAASQEFCRHEYLSYITGTCICSACGKIFTKAEQREIFKQ